MSTAAPELLETGSTFGAYKIEGLIGRGGMGVVYEATQLSLNRKVAVKVLSFTLADDSSFRERFRREQRVMAAFEHPNVCPIYEAGEVDGRLYLVMRLVRGPTLKDLIVARELDPGRTAQIIAQTADALDTAHEAGLIHRDIKPQNVLIDERDHAYLADFGLAVTSSEIGITQTGQFVGTIDYVSPEQIRGEPATAMADVYALGCVLYEALTGVVPYPRPTDAAVLYAHLSDPPPVPSREQPSLSPAFDAIVARALAKDPHTRYPTAGSLAEAVLAAAEGAPAPPVPASPAPELGIAAAVEAPAPPPPPPVYEPWTGEPEVESGLTTLHPTAPPPPPPEPGAEPPPASFPDFATFAPRGSVPLRIRLNERFRYVHHPLADDRDGIPMLGNEDVVGTLKERIVHSVGGSFLITGFRGVGKTTVIARALAELRDEGEEVSVLPVSLNVARPRTVEELLFEVIRRVFETLKDEELFERMAPRVQRELLLAYARTSLSFNETRSKSTERGGSVSVGIPPVLLDALSPKLELSRRTTDSLATQASFLAYTNADVEHDFLRIVALVERGEATPIPSGWTRMRQRVGRGEQPAPHWRGKLVVVIDELDKLTEDEEGMKCIQTLLTGLKNLLTARGVHFLFVAGPDLHDASLRDSRRGNSVYESVFGWQLYVPCLWDATERLLAAVIDDPGASRPQVESLRDYLRFKSRGVPRLLLMELNAFVRWDEDGPFLEVGGANRARVEFYAALERVLGAFVQGGGNGARPFSLPIDDDRWRLGAYYLTDWILQSEGSTFTVDELISSDTELAVDPMFSLSHRKVAEFLDHLVRHEIIEQVRGLVADQTYYGDVPSAQEPIYRLARDVGIKLAAFARINERERADLGEPGPNHQPWADSEVAGVAGHGRYELVEELDRGGLGRVYKARDRVVHREVAVKLFDAAALPENELMRARFARKADIARSLEHPNIVPTHETFEEDDRLGIVMGLVNGTSLEQLLSRARLTASEAVRVAMPIADALEYVHEHGVARLDLKPSSILIDECLRPLILDLGLAKVVRHRGESGPQPVTAVQAVLGTPAYAAPEQLRGEDADIRSDIFSLGLILYEMLTGRRARSGGFSAALAKGGEPVDVSRLKVSAELQGVVARAVAHDRDERFATPADLRDALATVPELAA